MELGAPNAMNKQIDANFFGETDHEMQTSNNEMLEMMGVCTTRKLKQKAKDINEMANRTYVKYGLNPDSMNARQAF